MRYVSNSKRVNCTRRGNHARARAIERRKKIPPPGNRTAGPCGNTPRGDLRGKEAFSQNAPRKSKALFTGPTAKQTITARGGLFCNRSRKAAETTEKSRRVRTSGFGRLSHNHTLLTSTETGSPENVRPSNFHQEGTSSPTLAAEPTTRRGEARKRPEEAQKVETIRTTSEFFPTIISPSQKTHSRGARTVTLANFDIFSLSFTPGGIARTSKRLAET